MSHTDSSGAHPRPRIRRGNRWLVAGTTGALAGLIAATMQSAVGWVIQRAFLPPGYDNNIAPRLVNRALRQLGQPSHPAVDWIGGVLFHYVYGIGWGALFGLARRAAPLPPPALGTVVAGLIYLLAFSRVGVGTRTGAEQHPDRRPAVKQASLIAIVLAYVVSLVVAYDRLDRRGRTGGPPDEEPRA